MPLFVLIYFVIAVLVAVSVFLLSYNENKSKHIKAALTVIYIVSVIGVLFATGCLEGRYLYSKITSTVTAIVIVAMIYGADTLGAVLRKKKEDK